MKCRYCPQLLTTPESKARGYGPVCGRRRGLIPLARPRRRGSTKPATTPDVPPGQTAIPYQPELPKEN
ncbi:DUF6011 domain-containing protein [Streptomyces spinosisporus]|uniref:DUF6011 domain-containing protein n=1 Tax=Streptomyces spinosisporus TaxID=2927582 RepID=A0ABS9XH65_9ACTN|nr:DUF6011 domain-containing protein [Streptomyces spinosisporus]MCI3240252.1 DUF6011 domain-containing protein [Streptomyces spinosisporus]